MGCLKRIGLFILGWVLFKTIFYSIILYVFGQSAGIGAMFIATIAGVLFVLFGGIFDDSNGPPSSDNDGWRRLGEAAGQNQSRGKYK